MAMIERATFRIPEDQERELFRLARRNRMSHHEVARQALAYALRRPAFRHYLKRSTEACQAAARDALRGEEETERANSCN